MHLSFDVNAISESPQNRTIYDPILLLLLMILQQDKQRYRVYNTYTTKEKEKKKYYNYPTAGILIRSISTQGLSLIN